MPPQSAAELENWYRGTGNPVEARGVEEILRRFIPGLRTTAVLVKPCANTYHPNGDLPIIAPIVEDKVMVAAAGSGAAAKSSNEIGRLAALQMMRMAQVDIGFAHV